MQVYVKRVEVQENFKTFLNKLFEKTSTTVEDWKYGTTNTIYWDRGYFQLDRNNFYGGDIKICRNTALCYFDWDGRFVSDLDGLVKWFFIQEAGKRHLKIKETTGEKDLEGFERERIKIFSESDILNLTRSLPPFRKKKNEVSPYFIERVKEW